MLSRWLKWAAATLGMLMIVLSTAAFFADEPLRRYVERTANEAVEGYSFKIGTLSLHPLSLSVNLGDVVVRQETHSDPPLISIPEVVVDARFASLLKRKAEGEIHLNNPIISATQQQINTAAAKAHQTTEQTVPRQDRVRGMIPFEAAVFIKNGEVRYAGQPDFEPIRMTALDIEAHNLTNRPKDAQSYPSELVMRSRLFDAGRLEFNGRADLLTKPLPMVDAFVKVSGLYIADLMPIVGAYRLVLSRGTFSATGRIMHEKQTVFSLESFVLEGARVAYVYREETKSEQRRQRERGAERAAKAHRDPGFLFKVGHGKYSIVRWNSSTAPPIGTIVCS